jgi:hypothetical protein
MKKIFFNKKLSLKKATVANLSEEALNKVQGGTGLTLTCPAYTCYDTCFCTKPYINTCGNTCDFTCDCGTFCSDCWTLRFC